MRELQNLFTNNRQWAEKRLKDDPEVFTKQSKSQSPKYLWFGCSDSRMPANEILQLSAGEVFVHRNVGNLFPHTDMNCLSVLQYGVDYLGIEHVIVCGHYGCGGVLAAMKNAQLGLVDNWLRYVRDIYSREYQKMDALSTQEEKADRLVELNVLHQVMNVCHTTIVQNTWAKGRKLSIHGWVYDMKTGLLKDLDCCISTIDQIEQVHRTLKLH